jgi:hypothetical protein
MKEEEEEEKRREEEKKIRIGALHLFIIAIFII